MFTGIIEATTPIVSARTKGRIREVAFKIPPGWKLRKGESVAVDGICSTVAAVRRPTFSVQYVPETLTKTTAAKFVRGRMVNLERPLAWHGRVHGHFVLGHVDGKGSVTRMRSKKLEIRIPQALMRSVAHKGSITINGVALTVAGVTGSVITIALIPYTLTHTNLGALIKGDRVNVEVDLLARYTEKHAKKALRKKR